MQSGCEISEINFQIAEDLRNSKQSRQELFAMQQINKIEICSNQNMLVAGTEDSKIRFFDLNSNKLINSVIGHADSVTSLRSLGIQGQPNLIVSGGHDGSVRVWDIRNF